MKFIKYSRTSKINIGDYAISEAIKYLSQKICNKNVESFDILFEDFDVDKRVEASKEISTFYKVVRRNKFKSRFVLELKKILFLIKDKKKIQQQIDAADCVIVGGGNLFSEKNGSDMFHRAYQIIKMAKNSNKKIYVYAVGVGPFQFNYKKRLHTMIEFCNQFYVRDISSKLICDNSFKKNTEKIKITIDPAFILSDMYPESIRSDKYIGINFMNFGNIVPNSTFDIDKIISNLKNLYAFYKKPFKIINTSFGEDLSLSLLISKALNDAHIDNHIINIKSMKDIPIAFSDLDFFIASRMHSSIFAMSYNVPTIIYPWHQKIIALNEFLFEDKKEMVLLKSENFDADEILTKIKNYKDSINLAEIILDKKSLIYRDYEALVK